MVGLFKRLWFTECKKKESDHDFIEIDFDDQKNVMVYR
jgi:hypothetical protein